MTPPPINIDGTNENYTNVTIDGQDVTQITIDGQDVLSTIPDSVQYQHRAEDFASPWPANIGTSSGTIIGGTSTTTFSNNQVAVEGDGNDDGVTADGPEQLPTNTTFGVAVTAQFTSTSNDIFGAVDGSGNVADFRLSGNLEFLVRDRVNGNALKVTTGTNEFADGNPHAIVINKRSNDANDIEFYVDDMSTDISAVATNKAFSTSDYANDGSMGYFARAKDNGSLERHRNVKCGVFEWNTEPYSQSERDGFVSRRPEV